MQSLMKYGVVMRENHVYYLDNNKIINMNAQKIISGVVFLLGVYMIVAFNGGKVLVPPVISGVALILIAMQGCLKK